MSARASARPTTCPARSASSCADRFGIYFDRPRGGNAQALVGNTFVSTLQTLRYSQLQSLGGLLTQSPAQLTAYQYNSKLPTSTEWSTGIQMLIPWSTSVDVAYVGHHNYNAELTGQVNAVDIGSAFDPSRQDPTSAPSATPAPPPWRPCSPTWCAATEATRRSRMRELRRVAVVPRDPVLDQPALPEWHRVRLQRRDHAAGHRQGRAALQPRRLRPASAPGRPGRCTGAARRISSIRGTS